MDVIAKHIQDAALKYKIYEVDTICAFTCQKISKGVKLHDLVSDNFTDWEYIKVESGYVGLDMAKCIGDTIKGKTRNNALRNYSKLNVKGKIMGWKPPYWLPENQTFCHDI